MLMVTQSQQTFDSGGRSITLDAFLPESNGQRFPAVIGLHGSAGGHASMSDPAAMLAARGFAVYVLHYFDRTGTTGVADKQTAIRNFPAWGKTLWDAISHVELQACVDPKRIGLLGFSLGAYLALTVASVDSRVKAVVEFFGVKDAGNDRCRHVLESLEPMHRVVRLDRDHFYRVVPRF